MGPKNKTPPHGTWYYSIKISNTTEQTRNQHEILQELIDDSTTEQKLHTGFGPTIRNDWINGFIRANTSRIQTIINQNESSNMSNTQT